MVSSRAAFKRVTPSMAFPKAAEGNKPRDRDSSLCRHSTIAIQFKDRLPNLGEVTSTAGSLTNEWIP
jgi:hypothetical protein